MDILTLPTYSSVFYIVLAYILLKNKELLREEYHLQDTGEHTISIGGHFQLEDLNSHGQGVWLQAQFFSEVPIFL